MQSAAASIEAMFARLASEAEPRLAFERTSLGFDAWQATLREKLVDLLRLDPRPHEPPPVEIVRSETADGYVRELIYLQAADGVQVPAYVLRPQELSRPAPAMLALHGHGPGKVIPVDLPPEGCDRQTFIVEAQRDYAVQAVRRGMVVVAPDLRGFGELTFDDEYTKRSGNSCTQMAMRAIQLGRTLLGMRIGDLMQFVDWLAAQDFVDASRIGATGNSGGGTATLFLAAVDTRVALAVPSCYFCTFQASLLSIHHCPCNYVPDLSLVAEMYDIAGLVAPRPMLIVAGQEDPIFPIQAVRHAFGKLRRIYEAADAADRLELYVGSGGHRYYSERVWPFVREHFGKPTC